MDTNLERILQRVQKPGRYVGGEYGQIVKDRASVDLSVAFCFPDAYEIGMSNLGLGILYGVLNGIDGVRCERVFAPWPDMEEQMRSNGIGLYGLESGDPVRSFDIVAFSIGYELSYTNVLNMLDLAGIEPRAAERPNGAPLVIAGGNCCFNPEPLSEFFDLFVVGDGEEVICEIVDAVRAAKVKETADLPWKSAFLSSACGIAGVYVPLMYDVSYNPDGTICEISARSGAPFPVRRRIVNNLDDAYFPTHLIVPSTEIVHDRVSLELFRGCSRGCRFCQAGHINNPVRARSCRTLVRQGIEALEFSGYDELSLLSLSSSDYKHIVELCDGLLDWCRPRRKSLSLPSLRADNFSIELMENIQKVRKSGLTFAPEAGSQRLRDHINKNVTEEELLQTCRIAFEGGWNSVKLYFMLGLPTETDEDVAAIADVAHAVLNTWKRYAKNKSRGVRISVSTSCFIPKPHTPFQREPQVAMGEYLRRVDLLRNSLRTKAISYSWHSAEQGFIEAALSRGDRQMGAIVYAAHRLGARFDSWSEHFDIAIWEKAFEQCGVDAGFYTHRERSRDEVLPWSVISAH